MSLGTRPVITGSFPPNMMFSPDASRWLFRMRYGPGPPVPEIACESEKMKKSLK
jgi:hypothetical protein